MWGAYGVVVVVVVCRNVVCFQILSYFILEDFIFYWGHRILHTKWLYKHVHSVHHECVISTLNLHTYIHTNNVFMLFGTDRCRIVGEFKLIFLPCLFAADMPLLSDWHRSTPILRRFCFWVLLPYLDLPSLALIFWHSGCGWACESLRQLRLIAVTIFPGAFPDTCQSTEVSSETTRIYCHSSLSLSYWSYFFTGSYLNLPLCYRPFFRLWSYLLNCWSSPQFFNFHNL